MINLFFPEPANDIDPETESNMHLEILQSNRNQTSIAHINTQSLLSSFDEFTVMLNIYKFDIITLSETWLQSNQQQLDYVKIPGYNQLFKNRDNKRGGGVGLYAKENFCFTPRNDLTKNCNLEILCTEFRGRNKNTPFLVIAVYQPSSKEEEKLDWLVKFDGLLADITIKWNGIVLITGDTNIDLLGDEKESTKRYKDILNHTTLNNTLQSQ